MERGLCQGDPLSPFLFIIAAEAIHVMLGEAVRVGLYNPAPLGSSAIQVPLLQFADDVLFLGEWSCRNVGILLKLLKCFKEASGLKINLNNSCLTGVSVTKAEVKKWPKDFTARPLPCLSLISGCQLGTTRTRRLHGSLLSRDAWTG